VTAKVKRRERVEALLSRGELQQSMNTSSNYNGQAKQHSRRKSTELGTRHFTQLWSSTRSRSSGPRRTIQAQTPYMQQTLQARCRITTSPRR
jgi:hypothetical protein